MPSVLLWGWGYFRFFTRVRTTYALQDPLRAYSVFIRTARERISTKRAAGPLRNTSFLGRVRSSAGVQWHCSRQASARGNDEAQDVLAVLQEFSSGPCGPLAHDSFRDEVADLPRDVGSQILVPRQGRKFCPTTRVECFSCIFSICSW